jgi:hypothetical protein
MICAAMRCKMSYKSCILRQTRMGDTRRWGRPGHTITTDECRDCEQGAEVMRLHGKKFLNKEESKPLCACGGEISSRGMCRACYNRWYHKKRMAEKNGLRQSVRKGAGTSSKSATV